MYIAILIALVLAACGDNHGIAILLDGPEPADAELQGDATDCCAFYPDVAAIGACAAPSFPPCTCGVIACRNPDGGFLKFGACGPPDDAGTCTPVDAGIDADGGS